MNRMIASCLTLIFTFFIIACGGSSGGGSDDPNPVPPANGFPSVPTGLTAIVVSTSQINLSWNASVDNSAVFSYLVHGGPTLKTAMATQYSMDGLDPNTSYCFAVSAIDDEGNHSEPCKSVCATTDPAAGPQFQTVLKGTDLQLNAVAFNGTRLVAVTEDDMVYISDNAEDWTLRSPSMLSPQGMNDVVWNGTRFVGVEGWMYTSLDGISWNVNTNPDATGDLMAVTYSDLLELHIAVGEDGLIMSSSDGTNWIKETSPTPEWLTDVTWGSDRFLAAGNNGVIVSSLNGKDWEIVSSGTTNSLNGVVWNGTIFVIIGSSEVLVSTDGEAWSLGTAPTAHLDSIAYSSTLGLFASVGLNGVIFTSSDGITWTDRADPNYGPSLNDVIWTGSQFLAVGDNGEVMTSGDGIIWDTRTSGDDITSVIWDGSRFLAIGHGGRIVTSVDGERWNYSVNKVPGLISLDIAWSETLSIYGMGAQSVIYSFDGLEYITRQWLGATTSCHGMIFDGTRFVGVGSGSGGSLVWTSLDGKEYTYHDPGTGSISGLYGVTWNAADQYVAVGYRGQIITSADATAWTIQTSNTTENLYGANFGNGQYVVVGAGGNILTSSNGADWTPQVTPVNTTLYDVTYTGGEYVAAGASGRILFSDDGITWTAANHGYTHYKSIASNGTALVIVGDNGTIIKRR